MDDARGKPLGVAVVGAGYWGPNLARNFSRSQQWDLRWICDLDRERAQRIAEAGTRITDDIAEVLADPDIHAVAIATPASTHGDVALSAIAAGKNILIEKPLASTYAEGAKIVDAAESQGLVLMCDHTFCYTPAAEYLRETVADGSLGRIQYFDSVRINLGLVQSDIDVLWDLAPHDLSILDFVLPGGLRATSVAAHGSDPLGTGKVCVAYLTLHLPGHAIAHIHANWLSPVKVRTLIIVGSKRTAVWDDMNPMQRVSVFDRGVDMVPQEELDFDARTTSRVAYRIGDMHAPALSGREALTGVVDEFAAAIREQRPARTDGRSGLRVLEILEAASCSLAQGGAVVSLRGEES